MSKLNVMPSGRLFKSCKPNRIAQIQNFIDILVDQCGVKILDTKEQETTSYCRIDLFEADPRWIRLYPSSRSSYFVAAFFIAKRRFSSLNTKVAKVGLVAEEGKQKKSADTERLRIQIPDTYDLCSEGFQDLLESLLSAYKEARI